MSNEQQRNEKSHKKWKIKQKPVLEQVPVPQQQQQAEDGNSRFARALGSTDYGTREKGLQALSRFLLYKASMSDLDMMKLWKGLFFCFWHSDKVPVQTELAERLAGLLQQLQPAVAQQYWAGLLATVRREWGAMDHHRLDKFLMLVRKFVGALMARLQAAQWDACAISSLTMQLPMGQIVIPTDSCKSLGLSYHLSDVWLRELKHVADQQAVPNTAMLLLLEPFLAVLESSGEQALIKRIKETVFDVLVTDLTAAAAGEGEQQDWMYCSKVKVSQLATAVFDRGAAEGVKARNRQALYSISKDLERAAGKRRKVAAAAPTPAAEGEDREQKKEKKAHKKKRQQEQEEQPQQQEVEQQKVQSTNKKKMQKQQDGLPQQLQEPSVASAVTPSSSKKQKALAEQQLKLAEAAAAVTHAAAAATATPKAAAENSGKKKRKHSGAAVTASATPTRTPTAGTSTVDRRAAAAAAAAAASASKKGVKIDLRKNVYFAHGAPVPPEEVRSPPNTKPKGSALKTVSRLSKLKSSPAAPATAPAKQHQGSRLPDSQRPGRARKAVTPNSVPRVKAAAFF